jgi:L-lactate dehydrogenase complex protein LldF
MHDKNANTLPYASSLCGACFDACPVRIDIPEVLVYLRSKTAHPASEAAAMKTIAWFMEDAGRFGLALRLARLGQGPFVRNGTIDWLPGPLSGWTDSRDLGALPKESFREWWKANRGR